jgi:hypothetical protein
MTRIKKIKTLGALLRLTYIWGSFKPESDFLWSNIALNRSFCDFRYLESEFWKRSYFGRFWSIKVKKTAKSLFSMLGTVPDGVKSHNLTASDVSTINFTESSWRRQESQADGVRFHGLIYREMVTASHTGRQEYFAWRPRGWRRQK